MSYKGGRCGSEVEYLSSTRPWDPNKGATLTHDDCLKVRTKRGLWSHLLWLADSGGVRWQHWLTQMNPASSGDHGVFYLQCLPSEPSSRPKQVLTLSRGDPVQPDGAAPSPTANEEAAGQHQAGQVHRGPPPTAASCLAEGRLQSS